MSPANTTTMRRQTSGPAWWALVAPMAAMVAMATLCGAAACDPPKPPAAPAEAPPSQAAARPVAAAPLPPVPAASSQPAASAAPVALAGPAAIDLTAEPPRPAPEPDVPAAYPAGVVPLELLRALAEAASGPNPPIAQAEACEKQMRAGGKALAGCGFGVPSIAAFNAAEDKVAFLDAEAYDTRDDCSYVIEVIVPLGKPGAAAETRHPARKAQEGCPQGTAEDWAAPALVAELARGGYADARGLVKKQGTAIWGAWEYRPVAVLRAPLRGFLLHASADKGNTKIWIDLVEPDNKTRHRLGSTPLRTRTCVERTARGGCARSSTFQAPTVDQAALSPDQKHLVVLLRLNTPEPHDTTETYVRKVFDVPAGVIPGGAPAR
jgi:hypothetical protein